MIRINRAYEREEKYVERQGVYESQVEKRVERGYRLGYEKKQDKWEGTTKRTVQLSYRHTGQPGICKRYEINQRVSAKERWGRRGRGGMGRRETTEGRKTVEEARRRELGGKRIRWVR